MIIDPHINIFAYHWVWYMLGFICVPRLTFMIWVSIYFGNSLPLALMIIGWLCALGGSGITIVNKSKG